VAEAPLAEGVFQVDQLLGELVELPVRFGIAVQTLTQAASTLGDRRV
jgi:hypothetical protein